MIKRKSKTDNPGADNSYDKLAFFENYFRELYNDDITRMERIESKAARLLSAISIIVVVLGWKFQSNCITQFCGLFTVYFFSLMIAFLLISWFYFVLSLDFVETETLDVDNQLIDNILDPDYKLNEFNEHAIRFYGEVIIKNKIVVDKKANKAKSASFFTKLTFGCFCLLLLNILLNCIKN